MKPLPIGISDYKEIIETDCYYVDKTVLIQEILSFKDKVTLLCRPRRFGKTLNLSMLKYFFEQSPVSRVHLFQDKLVWAHESARAHQGKYPVIFISFKDVKSITFQEAYENITLLIGKEFARHHSVIAPLLKEHQEKRVASIIEGTASVTVYQESLLLLSELLFQAQNKQVVLLLDEYDTPIHAAYTNGYYNQMVAFIKTIFGKVLKDNVYLERGVLTGILRTAKEGIFSDLNNLTVCTLLSNEYADKFGFTEEEVVQLIKDQDLNLPIEKVAAWYNGYNAGDSTLIYNPWSILMCARQRGDLKPYWSNTSGNDILRELIIKSSNDIKKELELLLQHTQFDKTIEESFTFSDIIYSHNALWSLLFFSGYLTYSQRVLTEQGKYRCSLRLPNHEVEGIYRDFIETIFSQTFCQGGSLHEFLRALIAGDVIILQHLLQEFVINSMSFHDIDAAQPERSYHLFVLGLLVTLTGTYQVRSNRESGYGRYDIMLIPIDTTQPGVVIEFKKALSQGLEQAADAALEQIADKRYVQELHALGITEVRSYGIAFEGKQVLVKQGHVS